MNTVTIGISSLKDAQNRTAAAFRGKKQGARISFATEELLWQTLTPKRWALLKTMVGQGALPILEIASRVDRDVHSDVHVFLKVGMLEREDDGRVIFPLRRHPRGFPAARGVTGSSSRTAPPEDG